MILAAGRGKRLRPLTDHLPKPLLKIGDKALIEYRLAALAKAGVREVVINLAYMGETIFKTLGNGARYGIAIYYSHEPKEGGLETGGGIFQALPLLGNDPFIITNADVWTDFPLETLPNQPEGLAHLIMVDNPPHNPQGDFGLQDGYILETNNNRLTFSGIYVLRPELFANCTAGFFSIVPLLRKAMQLRQVTGVYYPGIWQDLGTLEQFMALSEKFL